MCESAVLSVTGDSIWGRITELLSSILNQRCSGNQRNQFYEALLMRSLDRSSETDVLQYMIDSKIAELNRSSQANARHFVRLIEKLKRIDEDYENDLGFLLSFFYKQNANQSKSDDTECNAKGVTCSRVALQELQSNNFDLNKVFVVLDRKLSSKNEEKDIQSMVPLDVQHSGKTICGDSIGRDKSETNRPNEFASMQCTKGNLFGPIYSGVVDNELLQMEISCKKFITITWTYFLPCVQLLFTNQTSFLFRLNNAGRFVLWNKRLIYLKLVKLHPLKTLATPFIAMANSLRPTFEMIDNYQTLKEYDSMAVELLVSYTNEFIQKIGDSIISELLPNRKVSTNLTDIERLINSIEYKFRNYSVFIEMLHDFLHSTVSSIPEMINTSFITRSIVRHGFPESIPMFDDLLIVLLQFFDRSLQRWIVLGEEDLCRGVLIKQESNYPGGDFDSDDLVRLWLNNFYLLLPPCALIGEDCCKRWLMSGRLQKLMALWSNSTDQNYRNSIGFQFKRNSVLSELEPLDANELKTAFNDCLPKHSVEKYLDGRYKSLASKLHFDHIQMVADFREIFSILSRTLLCTDGIITDIIVSNILIATTPKESFLSHCLLALAEYSCSEQILKELRRCRFSERLVQGLRLISHDAGIRLQLQYVPIYPLRVIFSQSRLKTYENIWLLLMRLSIEVSALSEMNLLDDIQLMVMRSRMLNYLISLQTFFFSRIESALSACLKAFSEEITLAVAIDVHEKFVENLQQHCFLDSDSVVLTNFINAIFSIIAKYRVAVSTADVDNAYLCFTHFNANVSGICNVVEDRIEKGDFSLAGFLLLIDYTNLY